MESRLSDSAILGTCFPFRPCDHDFIRIICGNCYDDHLVPVKCGNRFCPTCQVGRQSMVRERLKALFNLVPRLPYRTFKLLTLTIPNQSDVGIGYGILIDSFRRLRNRKWWRKRVYGGVFVVEVTQGKSGYHVHMHVICQAFYIDKNELKINWKEVSPGSVCNVLGMWNIDASRYLTKYLTKVKGDPIFVMKVGQGLKGKRLYQPFGKWLALDITIPKLRTPCRLCGATYWIPDIELRTARTIYKTWADFYRYVRNKDDPPCVKGAHERTIYFPFAN